MVTGESETEFWYVVHATAPNSCQSVMESRKDQFHPFDATT
jgi:hypothetical protein